MKIVVYSSKCAINQRQAGPATKAAEPGLHSALNTTFPHLTTAMHDMGSLGHTLQIDLPRDWANLLLCRDLWRGVVSQC